ncbi:hypothetical protein BGX38DRAFT_1170311 [Terfezia claveryi]|nr:hypothetical protein BGX38DRAFT_1170311 [Terfezia claveryi]
MQLYAISCNMYLNHPHQTTTSPSHPRLLSKPPLLAPIKYLFLNASIRIPSLSISPLHSITVTLGVFPPSSSPPWPTPIPPQSNLGKRTSSTTPLSTNFTNFTSAAFTPSSTLLSLPPTHSNPAITLSKNTCFSHCTLSSHALSPPPPSPPALSSPSPSSPSGTSRSKSLNHSLTTASSNSESAINPLCTKTNRARISALPIPPSTANPLLTFPICCSSLSTAVFSTEICAFSCPKYMKKAALSTSGLASHGWLELGVPGVAGLLDLSKIVGSGVTGLGGVDVGEVIIDRRDRVENVRPIRFVPREKDPSSRSSLTIAEIRTESENLPLETLLNQRLL